MVSLLISVICKNAKEGKEIRETRNERENEENYDDLSNGKIVDIDELLSDSSSSKANKLAQKFAKDALKSPKIQETINKLSNIGASRNDLDKVLQLPAQDHGLRKSKMKFSHLKPTRQRDRTNKKRKRHKHRHRRKRLKDRQPRWSRKGPAKADSDSEEKQNVVKKKATRANGSSTNSKRNLAKVSRKNVPNDRKFISGNRTIINWDSLEIEDYIDMTQSTSSKPDTTTISMKTEETESMVQRLMKTTTKDPNKKNPGDQGIEYSDYYNDVDERDEGRTSKEKRKNPRTRSVRQSFTVSSSRRNYNDNSYAADENAEDDQNSKYLDENTNNLINYSPNSVSPESVQINDADDKDSLNYQIGIEQSISSNELKPKKSYDTMMLATGQDQNSRPGKMNRNFVKGASNSAFSQLGQNERSQRVLVGQENSVNTDANPMVLQTNDNQYTLPIETDDRNLYNNYAFGSGQELKVQHPVDDNLNYLNNYDLSLQKNNDKYMYPIVNNLPEDPINDQFQLSEVNKNLLANPTKENIKNIDHRPIYELSKYSDKIPTPEINKNEENAIELKNPTNVYSEPYEKTFVLPQEQQQFRYVPVYKNTDQGNRLLLVNPSNARNEARDQINEPLRKISNASSSREHVQPVQQFLDPADLESEKSWMNEDESENQQIIRRGLQKGSSTKSDELPAEREERLRREFTKRRNNGVVRNRYSVEEDVANSHRANIAATVNETKEVANQILNRIVDELEEIKMDRSKDKNNEGLTCKLTGSWVTSKAGVRIDMQVMNHSIIVTLANLIPQPMHLGLLNTTWNVTGHAPFKRGGPFSLFAYENRTKTIAVFVGSCRVCQGIDTIEGVWSVAHEPRDCRDFQMATGIFNDIFRRTKLLSAIKDKKKAILQSMLMGNITNTTSYSAVEKNEN
ncbi:hypothetical protein KPH14_005732 [Odynerus spinipes]|uniref:Uncharacterized protein n=1 Tax=Odynerus spinipes TaxID=1348599 RepID=A0AAD9RBG5_9HYME|nr:hypothetical protein KPH14_005732 [Odynerus spinipes]